MSLHVGIAIANDYVRIIGVRGGAVLWALEGERHEREPLATTIIALLARTPLPRWPRPSAVVAVGPSAAHTKRIAGLPPLSDPRALEQVVREGAGRFFLKNGIPLVTSSVGVVEPGVAWATAFELPLVQEVERACSSARVRLKAIVSSVGVVGAAFNTESIIWTDGEVSAELTLAGPLLTALRRRVGATSVPMQSLTPVPSLSTLGEHAWRFADAYGAAVLPAADGMAIRAGEGALDRRSPKRRVILAAAVLAFGIVAALFAPGIAATLTANRASTQLAALAARRRAAVIVERDLQHINAALSQVTTFSASRRSTTLLLAEITKALPTTSVLVAFRVDSVGGSLIALAPRASAVLAAVERVPGIIAPDIMGPVTREVVGAKELERVTLRFQLAANPGGRK